LDILFLINIFNRAFKKRAPRAVKELKKFPEKTRKFGLKELGLFLFYFLLKINLFSHFPYHVQVPSFKGLN
jgi:hypothetical protein